MHPALDLEAKVDAILARADDETLPAVPASLYLDLAESIVRQAARLQAPDGHVDDLYGPPGVETSTATGRYAGAVAHLLRAGRCLDLLESAMAALDWCCDQVVAAYREGRAWRGSGFYLKDALVLYQVLAGTAPSDRMERWTRDLASYDPEQLYDGGHNWLFYNAAAEVVRIESGLSDRHDYVEQALASQLEQWTPFGMYRDPNDPVTYDLTVRQGLAFMFEHGWEGEHAGWAREMLRRGALATLLFISPNGVAPYGGRSNQFHHMEAMIAYLAEWQAKEEARRRNLRLAGALRRMALAGAKAVRRWISRIPTSLKHQMRAYPCHGHDRYNPTGSLHAAYGLLAANLFGGAHHCAATGIPMAPAPTDVGGYTLHLADAFYRVWATAGGYHLQIDTAGQPGYDATGLGRFHKRGAPVELALNMSIVPDPKWHSAVANPRRAVAIGPGWPVAGAWRYLAEANRESHAVAVTTREENSAVELAVTYQSRGDGLPGATEVRECYRLSDEGLRCRIEVPGAPQVHLQAPLLETDGQLRSEVTLAPGRATVRYAGHTYALHVPGCQEGPWLEPWPAANRNGIYRVALFQVEGPALEYHAEIT